MGSDIVLGVDIGGTNLRMGLIDRQYSLRSPICLRVSEIAEDDFLSHLLMTMDHYLNENLNGNLQAIGIGVPGIVDRQGNVLSCPNITILERIDLLNEIASRFDVPVWVDKDVNLIMFGEYKLMNRQEIKNLIGFYIGTGFGCSMIMDGKLIRGTRGFAGELGHVPLKGKADKCNCGSIGCLEMYAAGRAVADYAAEKEIPVAEFFTQPDTNRQEVAELVENMAIGIVTATNLMDPQMIVIGGGVVDMDGFPLETLKREVHARLRSPVMKTELEIVRSQAGVFGGCIGAGVYCFDVLLNNSKDTSRVSA